MKFPEIVSVTLAGDRSYRIWIEPNGLSKLAQFVPNGLPGESPSSGHAVVITDEVIAGLYLQTAIEQLKLRYLRMDSIVIASGEETKSVQTCDRIWNRLLKLGTDRKTTIFALGGGVIGDLAGFVASSFARGLDYVQLPTTLLAQVDSSVGGKVGINLPNAKNMVGAFWQPRAVIIDPAVLATLDERNYRAGLAEVVKYGVIMDRPLFDFLEQNAGHLSRREPNLLAQIIAWCCRCKASVVEQDEREVTGRRAILNYGHTLGHAIESVFGYGNILHGEAVAIGMTFAARLAVEIKMMSQAELNRQSALLTALGLPTVLPASRTDELLAAMQHDKKVADGKLMLILPTQIGAVEAQPAPDEQTLAKVLSELR